MRTRALRHPKQRRVGFLALDVAQLVARLARARIAIRRLHDDLQVLAIPLLRGHLDRLLVADGPRGDRGLDAASGDGLAVEFAYAEALRLRHGERAGRAHGTDEVRLA